MSKKILAWHFVGNTLRDGRPVPLDGEVLLHDAPIKLCVSGLHASRRIVDALQFAPGNTICRVECGGNIVEESDKLVCTERTILWRVNGEKLLRKFARQCALDVIHLWDAPKAVKEYLETGDKNKQNAACAAAQAAARAATRDAARDATYAGALDAAWAAARAATRDAAWGAAYDAAWGAAWGAAYDAAWAAARGAALDALRDTACAAAWAAAWNAAWDAAQPAARAAAQVMQNSRLTEMVEAEHNM